MDSVRTIIFVKLRMDSVRTIIFVRLRMDSVRTIIFVRLRMPLMLLEHLLGDGIDQAIRIGPRSKSERLQDLNLRLIAQESDRTRSERAALSNLFMNWRHPLHRPPICGSFVLHSQRHPAIAASRLRP
ncbi:uncharacterized protein TRIVIDRAFT_217407 [Trichoderma virens Gv29-8]|uniref:Uncharacterized protein n=1 Tax=Hypocrea virens (strain Gv29-8 / FGSC 10586) TaxID=413071 RepID=G9MDU8_HYPVG|nr:uncharacterized protein TRIVIDRAFT_217407 [Trichoderma virens Gv29-8]EHK26796.1 hypothetical protein TRIVIDRAFT_217407 [Trichoderma virens Gv29-8]UKZ57249.1 hypothetical protein TrVGV298_011102 [Trichoderma virens]